MDIRQAAPDERIEAFALIFHRVPDEERSVRVVNALALTATGEIDPRGLLVARDDNGLAGAVAGIPLAGACGLLWNPGIRPDHAGDDRLAQALITAGRDWAVSQGCRFVQVFLAPEEEASEPLLLGLDFRFLTDLHYLKHGMGGEIVPGDSPAADLLQWSTFTAKEADIFRQTLLATYEGSLDCPELEGRRNVEEILAGHRGEGQHDPGLWELAWLGGRPVGVVLLTPLSPEEGWNLSYLGVVRSERGKGIGKELLRRGLERARAAGAGCLLAAVDGRNDPAIQLYRGMGFESVERRRVYLHFPKETIAEISLPGSGGFNAQP